MGEKVGIYMILHVFTPCGSMPSEKVVREVIRYTVYVGARRSKDLRLVQACGFLYRDLVL